MKSKKLERLYYKRYYIKSRVNYNFTFFLKKWHHKAAIEGKGNRYSENGAKRWKETEYKVLCRV